MKVRLLKTAAFEPVPDAIKQTNDWGKVTVLLEDLTMVVGNHVELEGEEAEIAEYLAPHNGWWLDVGAAPQLQTFELYRVRDQVYA